MAKYGKVDLELFDKNITEKLTRTQKELEYLKSNQKSSEAQSENASNGMGDLSKLNQQMEITQSLLEKCERKVKELLAAQHRVANGTYGICEESHKLISKDRLLAYPTARRMVGEKKKLTDQLNTVRKS